jgi:hypothetical protein
VTTFDYRAKLGGAEYDPADAGGTVSELALFSTSDFTGDPVGVVTEPAKPRPGFYRFSIPDTLPAGRYWCRVTFVPAAGAPSATDSSVQLDLPLGTGLVTSPEEVARRLRLPLPLTTEQREDFTDEIRQAQSDVEGYLARSLVPTLLQLHAVMPRYGVDVYEVDSCTALGDGTYDVTLRVGLDGAAERPIRRYVAAHASETLRLNGAYGQRRVTSVSAEGQSVSYETDAKSGSAAAVSAPAKPGELPKISSLDRYKWVPVFSRPKVAAAPWPYGPSHLGRW